LNHHPIFERFHSVAPVEPAEGFALDSLLGTVLRSEYYLTWLGPPSYPPPIDEEYFEWIDLLTAATAAQGRFVFWELGAGYGRWSIRAAAVAGQLGIPIKLTCVEADPTHFGWLRQTLIDNGLDPHTHTLANAAVCGSHGRALLRGSETARAASDYAPELWYGQSIALVPSATFRQRVATVARSSVARLLRDRAPLVGVDAVTLSELLDGSPIVDLVDMDVQGAELETVGSALDLLTDRVRRLHIGTHSTGVEVGLRSALEGAGWELGTDYSCGTTADTPFGRVSFQDGVQSWLNPRRQVG
jgi:FkbM family methyltransferase